MESDDNNSEAPLPPGMASLFNSNLYSDIEVRCSDDTVYSAHKAIICAQSAVLANACNPNHAFKEAEENSISLASDDPATVEALLKYLYCHDYDSPADCALTFHARMYAVGEFYQVAGLKALARTRFRSIFSDTADGWKDPLLPEAVEIAYSTTPESDRRLRRIVVVVAATHFSRLKENQNFGDVARKIGDFSMDVAEAMHGGMCRLAEWHQQGLEELNYRCPKCSKVVGMFLPDFDSEEGKDDYFGCLNCDERYPATFWEAFETEEERDHGFPWLAY